MSTDWSKYDWHTVPTTPYTYMGIKASSIANADEISEEQWHQIRALGIGGSDVGTIIGANQWKGPFRLNAERIGSFEAKEVGEAARWGNILESAVANEWSTRTGIQVRKVRQVLKGSGDPRCRAIINLDYIGKDPRFNEWGVVEVKTTTAYNAAAWGTEDAPLVPGAYWWQVQHYMAHTGLKYAWVVCLIGGQKLVERFVPFDPEEYARAISALEFFAVAVLDEKRLLYPGEILRLSPDGAADDIAATSEWQQMHENNVLDDAGKVVARTNQLSEMGFLDKYTAFKALREKRDALDEQMKVLKADILARTVARDLTKVLDGKAAAVYRAVKTNTSVDWQGAIAAGLPLQPFLKQSVSVSWTIK